MEEIAWRNGWLTSQELLALADPLLRKSGYGEYLVRPCHNEHDRQHDEHHRRGAGHGRGLAVTG